MEIPAPVTKELDSIIDLLVGYLRDYGGDTQRAKSWLVDKGEGVVGGGGLEAVDGRVIRHESDRVHDAYDSLFEAARSHGVPLHTVVIHLAQDNGSWSANPKIETLEEYEVAERERQPLDELIRVELTAAAPADTVRASFSHAYPSNRDPRLFVKRRSGERGNLTVPRALLELLAQVEDFYVSRGWQNLELRWSLRRDAQDQEFEPEVFYL